MGRASGAERDTGLARRTGARGRSGDEPERFLRLVLHLDDGHELRFTDMRKFGGLWLLDDLAAAAKTGLGPEPLGDEFTVEEVVDIFNRVNKAGTPLTKADLALAHICSIWPEARAEMRAFQAEMAAHGFGVDFNFLVRCLSGVATGSVMLEGSFLRVPATQLQAAWQEMKAAFEHLVVEADGGGRVAPSW